MTTTTDTAKAITIPAAGLTHTAGNVVITATPTAQGGYRIQVRIDGAFNAELSSGHTFETHALAAWNTLVEAYPVAAEPAVKLNTPKTGATKMSPAEVTVIGQALDSTGHIRRGRGAAAADLASLKAMARRGFITLTGPQFRPTGGTVTDWGKRIYKETVAEADAARDQQDRINRVLAYTAA